MSFPSLIVLNVHSWNHILKLLSKLFSWSPSQLTLSRVHPAHRRVTQHNTSTFGPGDQNLPGITDSAQKGPRKAWTQNLLDNAIPLLHLFCILYCDYYQYQRIWNNNAVLWPYIWLYWSALVIFVSGGIILMIYCILNTSTLMLINNFIIQLHPPHEELPYTASPELYLLAHDRGFQLGVGLVLSTSPYFFLRLSFFSFLNMALSRQYFLCSA